MKIICFMNGWTIAPHSWRHHFKSFSWEDYADSGYIYQLSILGFVWFIEFNVTENDHE